MLKSHSVPPYWKHNKISASPISKSLICWKHKIICLKSHSKVWYFAPKKSHSKFWGFASKKSRSKITFFPTPPKPKILSQVSDVIHLSLLYILVIYFHFLSFELFDARIRNWSEGIVSQDTQEITRVRKSLTKSPFDMKVTQEITRVIWKSLKKVTQKKSLKSWRFCWSPSKPEFFESSEWQLL